MTTTIDGWKLVPVEPTDEMLQALEDAGRFNLTGYRAMLDAAPHPPATQPSSDYARGLEDAVRACNEVYKASRYAAWQYATACVDCEKAIRELIPAVARDDGWLPIESAPHETNVLLAWRDWSRPSTWCMEAGMASWGTRTEVASSISRHGEATHWRPLPAPPKDAP